MKSIGITSACFGIAAAMIAWHTSAHANCAMPVGYKVKATGNSVSICPSNHDDRACPDASGMLREDATSHDVVKLDDFCSGEGYSGPCYLDECVPPGTWYYGFADPYQCCSACCGTSFYTAVEVTDELPEGCERSEGNEGPVAFAGVKPWKDDSTICNYHGSDDHPGSAGEAGSGGQPDGASGEAGSAGEAGTGGSASTPSSSDDDDGGCSISVGPRRAVLAVNALFFALGLGFLVRRRNQG